MDGPLSRSLVRLDTAPGLDVRVRPFVPAKAGSRGSPQREEERHGTGRRVRWAVVLVSGLWTVPRVPGSDKAKLFCTPGGGDQAVEEGTRKLPGLPLPMRGEPQHWRRPKRRRRRWKR